MIFEKQIEKIYKAKLFGRCDDTGCAFYFSTRDFTGLKKEPYSFVSSRSNKLQGYFYSYDGYNTDRLIVFDHGYGGGHRSYMKEIELLCRHGYRVFAYDHTGCMESSGDSTGGLAQSLSDLNDCISALRSQECFRNIDISVMGHSWGGFACLNIGAFHNDISHIVVLSGFVSVKKMVEQNFGGPLSVYRKNILALEKNTNPEYFDCDAVTSLKKTNAKALLIYSDNDKNVNKHIHFDMLKTALNGRDGTKFLLVKNKGHNPNYTQRAVTYLNDYLNRLTKESKRKNLCTPEQKLAFLNSFDWHRMTEQDDFVWDEIFDFLNT